LRKRDKETRARDRRDAGEGLPAMAAAFTEALNSRNLVFAIASSGLFPGIEIKLTAPYVKSLVRCHYNHTPDGTKELRKRVCDVRIKTLGGAQRSRAKESATREYNI
jgi:hypothetical protein